MKQCILPMLLLVEIAFFTAIGGTTFNSSSDLINYFKSYFADLLTQSTPVLLVAFGMTLVLMTSGPVWPTRWLSEKCNNLVILSVAIPPTSDLEY